MPSIASKDLLHDTSSAICSGVSLPCSLTIINYLDTTSKSESTIVRIACGIGHKFV